LTTGKAPIFTTLPPRLLSITIYTSWQTATSGIEEKLKTVTVFKYTLKKVRVLLPFTFPFGVNCFVVFLPIGKEGGLTSVQADFA
jgi:hypothetical protein